MYKDIIYTIMTAARLLKIVENLKQLKVFINWG